MNDLGGFDILESVSISRPRPIQSPSGVGDYIAASGLAVWILILVFQYWDLDTYWTRLAVEEADGLRSFKIAGLIVFGLGLMVGRFPWPIAGVRRIFLDPRSFLILAFFGLQILVSPLSISPAHSATYSTIALLLFLCFLSVWSGDQHRIQTVIQIMGFGIWIALFLLVLRHGIGTRTVGGIQPNQFAKAALVGMMAGSIRSGWFAKVSIVLAIGFAILVSSRSALIAAFVFVATWVLLGRRTNLKVAIVAVTLFGFLAFDLQSFLTIGQSRIVLIAEDIMLFSDPDRGLESGFTNRLHYWTLGFQGIEQEPILGHGFRTRQGVSAPTIDTVSAHNAYLNLILDTGVVGAFLFLSAVAVDAVRRFWLLSSIKQQSARSGSTDSPTPLDLDFELNRYVLSVVISTLAIWISEPAFLHIGMPFTVFYQFILASPYRYQGTYADGYRQIDNH